MNNVSQKNDNCNSYSYIYLPPTSIMNKPICTNGNINDNPILKYEKYGKRSVLTKIKSIEIAKSKETIEMKK